MKVSVIIPTYNRADLIIDTIDCVLGQTINPFEVIVVDDGSSDETEWILRDYKLRIRYIKIPNGGSPVARGVGASLATGDWLWFADSDDLWRPNFLQEMMGVFQYDQRVDFIFGNFSIVKDGKWDGSSKFDLAPPSFWDDMPCRTVGNWKIFIKSIYKDILSFQPIFPSAVIIKRELYDKVGGYDPQFARVRSEDLEFTLRCLRVCHAACLTSPLAGIRKHSGNKSGGDTVRQLTGEILILRHALQHHQPDPEQKLVLEREVHLRTSNLFDAAFAAGDFDCINHIRSSVAAGNLTVKRMVKLAISCLPSGIRSVLWRRLVQSA